MDFCEDNEAMIKICKSGFSQRLRHASRTHRVDVAFIVERFQNDPYMTIVPTASADQAADIYTKRFTDPMKWIELLYLNNTVDDSKFWQAKGLDEYLKSVTGIAPDRRGGCKIKKTKDGADSTGRSLKENVKNHVKEPI